MTWVTDQWPAVSAGCAALSGVLCRGIIEQSGLALVVVRLPDLVVVAANAAFGSLTGLRAPEVLDVHWANLTIWADSASANRHILRGAINGTPDPIELEVCRPTGEQRRAQVTSVLMREGEQELLVIRLHDVTEIRQAEEALIWQYEELDRQRREMAAILDAADEAMVLVSPDGRIANANRRFMELLALDSNDVLGVHVEHVRRRIRWVFGEERLAELLQWQPSDPLLRDTRLRQVAPERRDIELSVRDVRGNGTVEPGRLFTLRDITRQVELDRLKDEFLATVSHELRTPLTSISGFVDLLQTDLANGDAASSGQYFAIIQRNIGQLIDQVNELLDLSRLEAGMLHLAATQVDLAETLQAVVSLLGPVARERKQHISLFLPAALPPAWADVARTAQVATNLITNACKFSQMGSEIVVRVEAERDAIRVDVVDQGIGLTEREQELIFTRFYRTQTARERQTPGSGLGLPIARSLVERQGGRLRVTSAPGQGSTFSFTLPTAQGSLHR